MSLADRDGFIWMDGQFVPWREATVHCLTHTLHYGVGVFEGVRAYETAKGPAIFRLTDHTNRLFNSAKMLKIPMPFGADTLNQAQIEVISRNQLKGAYIRPMVFYGSDFLSLHAKNLTPHVIIAAWEWQNYFSSDSPLAGIRALTSTYRRHHIHSVSCKAKANGNYINSIMALQEISAHGYKEALMLDHNGQVAEGSSANFFMVRNNKLYTPNSSAALDGITRDTICTLAKDFGYAVEFTNIVREDIYIADEAFFTGTAAEVTPMTELDGRIIGKGEVGPITLALFKAYGDLVRGKDQKYEQWLAYV